ncbi:MAG TPA: hypothetical protein VFR47_30455 [Anaerolineales bacterium]|nr:hypothetical protein [Anaerolineales bacterium]
MIPDARTMGLIATLIPIVLGLIMTIYWRERKTYGGFRRWVLADFAFGLGDLLIILRWSFNAPNVRSATYPCCCSMPIISN